MVAVTILAEAFVQATAWDTVAAWDTVEAQGMAGRGKRIAVFDAGVT